MARPPAARPLFSRRRLRALLCALAALAATSPTQAERRQAVHTEIFGGGRSFDPAFWIAETGFFRNREAQYYRPDNIFPAGGALAIEGRREMAANAAYDPNSAHWITATRGAHYTSGSLVSREALLYGAVEIVARLPQSGGSWPAIWLVGERAGEPYREIDIVEAVGNTPGRVFVTVHAGPDNGHLQTWQQEAPLADLHTAFHAYRLDWRADAIEISIDGKTVLTLDPEAAHKDGIDPLRLPMRLRINLALGGSWGGLIDDAALPQRLEIKSVRVWRSQP
jgi:beta-glucanase (GH16 family)